MRYFALTEARQDPASFVAYVLRDERTGTPIKLAPVHLEWHNIITTQQSSIIWAGIEQGKSTQIAIGRTLWEIGKNPTLHAAVLSNTHKQASKLVTACAGYIEQSAAYKRVFPGIVPGKLWTNAAFKVKTPVISKDPTLQALGVHGAIMGARIDFLVVDDILDYENTRTPAAREALINWFDATIVGRLTRGAKVIVIGNAWHPGDALHAWAKRPGWKAFTYPVVDAQGTPLWPERWPLERIEETRKTMVPAEFARQLMCVARDDASGRFKREWIDHAMDKGEGRRLLPNIDILPQGCKVYTGVDLAVQRHDAADLTALFTIIVWPNGDREVVQIESGRWSGPEIVQRIFETHHRYQSVIIVENNGSQDFILQFAAHRYALPMRSFTTGRQKAHPEFGIEGIAAEMAQGKWIIPSTGRRAAPEVEAWIQDMLYYDPAAHSGDRLMASYFAREGIRMGNVQAESGYINLGPV